MLTSIFFIIAALCWLMTHLVVVVDIELGWRLYAALGFATLATFCAVIEWIATK